jgi:hypothetical protein
MNLNDDSPRQWTEDEIREHFLEGVWSCIESWDGYEGKTQRERLQGLAFSIMAGLDGAGDFPSCIVAPCPHPTDRAYHQQEGTNWYPENHEAQVEGDIGGTLHDNFYEVGRRRGYVKS